MRSRHFVAAVTVIAVSTSGLATAVAGAAEKRSATGEITVHRDADAGPGSLRDAIERANARLGADTITIDVDNAIQVESSLPAITDTVTLVGNGAEVRGRGKGDGLRIEADDVLVADLTLREFETGVVIDRASHVSAVRNTITDNRGAGIAVVGPAKEEVATLLASGTLDLAALMALIPTDIVLRENSIDANGGAAVSRAQEEILRVMELETNGTTARGAVAAGVGVVTVDVYASDECDSARPQAARLVGSANAKADGTFALDVAGVHGALTAIATDESAGSSAISSCATSVAPPAAPVASSTTTVAPTTTTTSTAPPTTATATAKATPRAEARSALSDDEGGGPQAVPVCTKTWTGAGGGTSWHTAANWNPSGVPGATDVVCIPLGATVNFSTGATVVSGFDVAGTLSVTGGDLSFDSASYIAALSLDGGTFGGAGDLEVDTQFTWTSGALTGTGTITVSGGAATLSSTGTKSLSKPLINQTTLNWTGGHLQMRSDLGGVGVLDNQGTLNINIPSQQSAGWCCGATRPAFTNSGTINFLSNGPFSLDNLDLTNTGTITLGVVTLTLTGSTTTIAGTITTTDTAGSLNITSGNHTFTGSVTAGVFDVRGGSATLAPTATLDTEFLRSFGGSLTVNTADANTTIDVLGVFGGDISAATNLAPTDTFQWTSGSLGGPGTLTLEPDVAAALTSDGTKSLSKELVNKTTVEYTGGHLQMRSDLGGVGELDNQGTLNINIPSQQSAGWCCGATRPAFTNSGTINFLSNGPFSLDNLDLTNTGTINLGVVTLTLTGSTTTIAGTITTTDTAGSLNITSGNHTFTGSVTVGVFDVRGGSATLAPTATLDTEFLRSFGGSLTVNTADANTTIDVLGVFGGDISAATNLAPTDTFQWTSGSLGGPGTLTLEPDVAAALTSDGTKSLSKELVNKTTVEYTGGHLQMRSDLGGVGRFENRGTLNINIPSQQSAGWCCGPTRPDFVNLGGTINLQSTARYNLDNLDLINTGTIDIGGATLGISGSTNTLSGTITGTDTSALIVTSGEQTFVSNVTVGILDVTGGAAIFSSIAHADLGFARALGGILAFLTPDANTEIEVLTVGGGTLDTTTNLAPTDSFFWTSGALTGPGVLTLEPGVFSPWSTDGTKSLSKEIVNKTTVEYTGGHLQMRSDLGGVGRLENRGILNINIPSQQSAGWCCGPTQPDFVNLGGTINLQSTARYNLDNLHLINTGTIAVGDATLGISGSTNTIGGTVTGSDSSALIVTSGEQTFTGTVNIAIFDVAGGSAIFNATSHTDLGFARALGGILAFLGDDANTSIEVLTVGGGTLDTTTNLAPTDSFFWTSGALTGPGVLTLEPGVFSPWSTDGTKSLSKELVNKTTVEYTGGHLQMRSDLGGVGHLDNQGTLNINIPSQQSAGWCCGAIRPDFTNSGTINKLSSALYTVDNLDISSAGTIDVRGGDFRLNGPVAQLSGFTLADGTWRVADDATLRIQDADIRTNAATIALEGPDARLLDQNTASALRNLDTNTGTIELGAGTTLNVPTTFSQAAAGRFVTHIGTDGHGLLRVGTEASLDGTVAAVVEPGFVVPLGASYHVVDAATLNGTFATVEGDLDVSYDAAAGDVFLSGDAPPEPPLVTVTPISIPEASGTFAVMVNGTGGNVPVDVFVSALDGTAAAPGDYSLASQTVTVSPNSSVPVLVTIQNDSNDEFDEVFTVLAGGAVGQITIVDDDDPPRAVIDGMSITEGDDGQIEADLVVRLVDPILGIVPQESGKPVVVEAITADGTAAEGEDYVATTGVVTFTAGQTTRTFPVPIIGDTVDEATEDFTVDLDALLDVTVLGTEDATVTIIDDDGSGGSPSDELESGGQAVSDALPQWGEAFNLDDFDFGDLGTDPFELPVITDDLADVFDTANQLDAEPNPLQNLDDDLDTMLDELEAAGFDVEWVEGGVGGRPAPPNANDILQLRYETTLADIAEAAGFSGDGFNDDMEGVLQGIASAYGLDASLVTSADLEQTLVLGVDQDGFYLDDDSGLTLAVDATANVSGAGDVAGIDGLSLSGTGTADLDVTLRADGGPARLRVSDLAGNPHAYLRPSATGTATLSLDAALDPLTSSITSEHTVTVDAAGNTHIATTATLDAALTLPDLDMSLHGTFDGTTWQLHGEGAADTDYALDGFTLENLEANATITPNTFTGSFDADVLVDLGNPEPAVANVHATFNGAALHATAHISLDDQTFGASPALVYLDGVTLDVTLDANVTTGATAITAELHADTMVLLPEPAAPGVVPDGAATATDVDASVDSDGNVSLHAGTLSGAIADAIDFTLFDVTLSFGPDAPAHVLNVASANATVPDLGDLAVTLTGFHLNRNGTFGASTIVVEPGTLAEELGIAGILPFDVDAVSIEFPDQENLDQFFATVDGSFDFTAMESLPFDPIIGIGDDEVTTNSSAAENRFTFTIAVDSFASGELRPYDFGPITLGFANLDVGAATIGATLTLGGYEAGEWQDDFGGTISLTGIDAFEGDLSVAVGGSLDVDASTLDLTGVFSVSANLSDDVVIEDADLAFALGVTFDDGFTLTGPTLNGLDIGRVLLQFGDFMRLEATGVDIDFDPAPGEPLITFDSIGVEFDEGASLLAGWGGTAGNVGIDADFKPILLPGFFVRLDPPPGEHFGLPDFIPLTVDDVRVAFPNIDLGDLPGEGLTLDDFGDFVLLVSGGVIANDTWPISATVDDLEVDLGKLARGEFPITDLAGFRMGVEPFELVPGFELGGGLGLGVIDVDGDADAPGEQTESVFYGEIFGTFSYQGMGAGVHLVLSEFGPVLAQVQVPLGIPIDGGFLGGVILASVTGGIKFGGDPFPNPDRPLDILHDPAFDTDFPITIDTIHDAVEPAVQDEEYTWDNGFTLALSGDLTHALAPGIVSGQVTIGANIGLDGGPPRLKLIGSGDVSVYGMPFAGAALLIDLAEPLEPQFDLAFETPQVGNPLAFLMPATGTFEVSLDTTGILPGFALGVRTFVERTVEGGLGVAQDFFDAALTELAETLDDDHSRPLAQLVLEGQPSGTTITRDFLVQRILDRIALGGNGLPADPEGAAAVARAVMFEILDVAGDLVDNFDLSGVSSDPDAAAFANVLGAGGEAVAAMLGVLRDAVLDAGAAFIDQLDPAFSLRGALQPVILGIPFGDPQHEVELIITKEGLGFGFETSFGEVSKRIADAIVPFLGSAALNFLSLGFEDQLGMTVELPIGGVVDGLFGGSGLPSIDPFDADWAIELRGGLRWNDFEIGQMTGLVIAADNAGFLDAHVQKLFENPDAPIDPNRIPIQNEQHYNDLLEHGGVLFNGRLLLPELLIDPVGLLSELNLELPENPFDLPDWVADIADHLTRMEQPANMQVFLPGFASVLDFDFDATTEADRITAHDTGQVLADKVNALFAAAYLEGTFEGELLSVPIGRALVEVSGDKVAVTGEIPLIGLDGTFLLDTSPVDTPIGPVEFPRAAAEVTIDDDDVNDVLAKFGIPPIFNGLGNADSLFRAYAPAYDITSDDPLLQFGGFELHSQLDLLSIVQDANFDMQLSLNGDVSANASVASFTPFPGITLTNGHVGFTTTAGAFAGSLDGTVTLPAWLTAATGVATAVVDGSFDSAGNVALSVTLNGVTYDLIALFTATVSQIVDFLVGLGQSFVQIAKILFDHVTQSVNTIVDQLRRVGANFIQVAQALFQSVTTVYNTIVDQLVRVGANLFDVAEAIRVGAAASFNTVVDQLVRLGANFVQIADVLFQKITTNVNTIVDQLIRKGATFIQTAEALFLKVTTNVNTIVDQLIRKGATFIQTAEALFLKVTTNFNSIVDQLIRKGASFPQLAEALVEKVTQDIVVIVDQLVRKGANFIQLADALVTEVTQDIVVIVDQLIRKGASFTQLAQALFAEVTTNLGTIITQLLRKGANITQIADALDDGTSASVAAIIDAIDDFTNASLAELVDALEAMATTSLTAIVDALEALGYTNFVAIAQALDAATSATVGQIIDAIDDATTASLIVLIDALEIMGTTALTAIIDALELLGYNDFVAIAQALLAATTASVAQIIDAIDDATTASLIVLIDALEIMGTTALIPIVDALEALGYTNFVNIAIALDQATTALVGDILNAIDDATTASLIVLIDALEAMGTTALGAIIDALEAIGYIDFVNIAIALDQATTALVGDILNAIDDFTTASLNNLVDALEAMGTTALGAIIDAVEAIGYTNFVNIAIALDQATTALVGDILNAIDDFTTASLNNLVDALEAMGTTALGAIIDAVEAIGYTNFVNIAIALDQATTALVGDILNAIDDFTTASLNNLIDALEAMGTTALGAIIDALEAIGYTNFVNIAIALDQATTALVGDILNAIDDFTTASLNNLIDALEAMGTTALGAIIDALEAIGYTNFVNIAIALDQATTALVGDILNAIDDFTTASLNNLVDALEAMGTTALGAIIDALEAIGYTNIVSLSQALDAATTATVSQIIDAVDDFTTASVASLVDALEAMGTTALGAIIDALEAIGYTNIVSLSQALDAATTATVSQIIDAVDDFTTASVASLVDALEAMGTVTLGGIVDALEAIGYTSIATLAEALDDATSASYRQITEALDDFTSASFSTIADALDAAGASFTTIVDALDAVTSASLNQIADAIRFAGATFTQVMQALEDGMTVDRYQTAAQLDRLGASVNTIINALVSVYNATIASIIDVLVDAVGLSLLAATDAVCALLGC